MLTRPVVLGSPPIGPFPRGEHPGKEGPPPSASLPHRTTEASPRPRKTALLRVRDADTPDQRARGHGDLRAIARRYVHTTAADETAPHEPGPRALGDTHLDPPDHGKDSDGGAFSRTSRGVDVRPTKEGEARVRRPPLGKDEIPTTDKGEPHNPRLAAGAHTRERARWADAQPWSGSCCARAVARTRTPLYCVSAFHVALFPGPVGPASCARFAALRGSFRTR